MLLTIFALTICAAAIVGIVVLFIEGFNAFLKWRQRRKAKKRLAREALFNPMYSDEELIKPPITAVN